MPKKYIILLLLLLAVTVGQAQQDSSFNAFRQRMMADYKDFRGSVLENYSSYLSQAWIEFEAFKAKARYPKRKPVSVPRAPLDDKTPNSITPIPSTQPSPLPMTPAGARQPGQPQNTIPPIGSGSQPTPHDDDIVVDFYGTDVCLPYLHVPRLTDAGNESVAALWRQMQQDLLYKETQGAWQATVDRLNLSDWLVFQLAREYSLACCAGDINTATVLAHYLLVNMGFDIRLGQAAGGMVLLVPFAQTVYGYPYLKMNGTDYFVMSVRSRRDAPVVGRVSTCRLPAAGEGRVLDLTLAAPNIQDSAAKGFSLSDGTMTFQGKVPEYAVRMANDFPQTDVAVYLNSCLSRDFRQAVLNQAEAQLKGLGEQEAVNRLLHYIQYAFKYEADGSQFGYEKPFFIEDNFYYGANDCEDRAVFFALIVREVLHLDALLVGYPNHECAAVKFSDANVPGDAILRPNGDRYVICDPTYIGAKLGMCMPQYEGVVPDIE